MRKKLQLGLIVGATTMLVAAGNCWADPSANGCANGKGNGLSAQCPVQAPEIDAGAGSGAIALLVGGLLLAAEKRRRCS